jgi:CBS domain containing-hemolysin-like protein
MEGIIPAQGPGEIIGIVACLIASAFFSGAETTLTRISPNRAEHLIESNPGRYGILRLWLQGRKRLLAALLVGNNLVNILASVLAYRLALRFLPHFAEAISVFGLTLVILVFAEITPKSLALQHAERFAVPVLRLVWVVEKLLFPLAWPLSRIPGLLGGPSGADDGDPVVTEDEIEFHIRRGVDREVFEEQEQGELLMSAVEFSDTLVKEVMVPRTDIVGVERGISVAEALERVIESGHSRLPVYDGDLDHVVGLLYAKDLLPQVRSGGPPEGETIAVLIRDAALIVPETQKLSTLLADMRRLGQHMATVVDEFGGTAGLVTLEDIIEELVGEIRDEFDPDEPLIKELGDGRWLVDARLSLVDFEDATDIVLPDTGDYESVGGFAVAAYGRIPKKGTEISAPGLGLLVVDSDARRVKRLEVRRTGAPPSDEPGRRGDA